MQLCQIFSSLCTVTKFNGTFTEDQKAEYFGEIVQIVMNTDEIKTKGYSLLKVLKQILINASKGARRGSSGWTKMTLNL
ncbi:hypothetical protein J5893_04485 [bacterium]|nr:hypothetical protein [bacterium]